VPLSHCAALSSSAATEARRTGSSLSDIAFFSGFSNRRLQLNLDYYDSIYRITFDITQEKTMKPKLIIGMIIVLIVGAAGAIWLYDWVLGDTQAASSSITAIPVEIKATATTAPQTTEAPPVAAASTNGPVIFQVVPAESEARFIIYEELSGTPTDVVGKTNQVAGEVAVDIQNLSASQVGVFQVNARTLATDNDNRNRAIRNRILMTDQYEYLTFTPKEIINLSGSAEPGQTFTFQVAGDLTIRDITQPVVFEITGKVVSATRLEGAAKTVIKRADYQLNIPSVPFVANVAEEVTIELTLVGEAKTDQ
jgi:polyisoprenoid-binding protein YceI